MNKQNKPDKQTLLVTLVLAASMMLAPLASGSAMVEIEGVAEVGMIEAPGSSADSGGSGSGSSSESSDSSDSSRCIISNPFGGGCLFEFSEHSEEQHSHFEEDAAYYYSATDDTRSGYYANVLGGAFWVRMHGGDFASEEGSGESGAGDHYDREYYENNFGYSQESIDESSRFLDNDYADSESYSEVGAESGVNTDVVGGGVSVVRQDDGQSSSSADEASSDSEHSERNFFDIPVFETGGANSHDYTGESQSFWNQTVVDGNLFLVNPVDATTVEIIGLRADTGDRHDSGSEAGSDSSSSYTGILGFTLISSDQQSDYDSQYTYVEEWLRVSIDLVEGTVSGDVVYEHGESEESSSSFERDTTEVFGIAFGSENSYEGQSSEAWRRVDFALDAAGTASASASHWDEDSQSSSTEEDNTIVILPFGTTTTEDREVHSDGSALGIDVGSGIVWLSAAYENRTSSDHSTSDFTIDHDPLVGTGSQDDEDARTVDVGAGSAAAGTQVSAGYEEVRSHESSTLRLGGDDLGGTFSDDEHWGTGAAGTVADGVFMFDLSYAEGTSDDGITIGSTPLGIRNDYQEFTAGAGGAVGDPAVGNLVVYSIRHEETSDQQDIYAGDSTIGSLDQTSTSDSVSFVVLDGLVSLDASRSVENTVLSAGGTEIVDATTSNTDAGADAGPASADVGVLVFYADIVDAFAVAFVLATWCADPGVPLPLDTVGGVLGGLPDPAGTVASTAWALVPFLMCGGVPVPAVALANDCLVADLATALAFSTAGGLTGLLPAGGSEVGLALGTAQDGYGIARGGVDDVDGCFWMTVPQEARNPQAVLTAMSVVQDPSGDPADRLPWGLSVPSDVPDVWGMAVGPTTAAYWPSTGDVWPLYDQARVSAYGMLDLAFGSTGLVGNPEVPMMGPTCETVPEPPAAPSEVPPAPETPDPGAPVAPGDSVCTPMPEPVILAMPVPIPDAPEVPPVPTVEVPPV